MSDRKVRIVSDRFNECKDEYGFFGGEAIPVDMYGKRVWAEKKASNLQEAAEDIKEFYGLTGKKGFS